MPARANKVPWRDVIGVGFWISDSLRIYLKELSNKYFEVISLYSS
jgi:hypothetical protein